MDLEKIRTPMLRLELARGLGGACLRTQRECSQHEQTPRALWLISHCESSCLANSETSVNILFAFPLIVFETRDVLVARFNFRKIPRTKSRQNSPERSGEVKSSDATRLVRPLWDQFPGIAEKGVAVLAAEDHEMTRGGII